MKAIQENELACVSGGEMSTTTQTIIVVTTIVSPLLGAAMLLGYYANSDTKDCG